MNEAPIEIAPRSTRSPLRNHLGWVLSLFLIGLALKFLLLQQCENSLPYLDQWEDEAAHTYVPYFEHQFSMTDLFRPNNEHRMLWTRIYNLGLLLLNGQWDSQFQMVANAIIHCATLAIFGWMMAGLLGPRSWPFIWAPLMLALALPFAWENTLWAMQSAFYFLLIFGLLTIALIGSSKPGSSRWRLGVLMAIASLFSLASGFLAVVAVAALALVEIMRNRTIWRGQIPTLAICAVITLAGLLVKVDVPRHHDLQAHSLQAFVVSLGKYVAWPNEQRPWLAPFNVFPLLLLGWLYLRSHQDRRPAEQMVLGLGFWVLLQSLAAAYARGEDGAPPASRYMDTCSFLFIANCLSIGLVCGWYRQRLRFARFWYAAFVIWGVTCGIGLWQLTDRACDAPLQFWKACQHTRVQTTRAFMVTDDEQSFHQDSRFRIPFPYVPMLVFLLRTPDIRNILPASVRDPLKVIPLETGQPGFVTNGCDLATPDPPTETSWGSFSGPGAPTRAAFESTPVRKSALPYLEIPVAGDLGESGLSLELIDQVTGKKTPVKPPRVAGKNWVNVYVRAPAGEFKIAARDESPTGWFAFKAPREMGRWSYWAMNLISAWKYIFAAGLGCLVWSASTFFRRPARSSEGRVESPCASTSH
jgi:hypothetical protein